MSAFRSWWAGVVYSIDATKEDIGRAGFNAGLEAAAKVCFTASEQVIAAIVDKHMHDDDDGAEKLRPIMSAIQDVRDAILALKDKV